jgi:predicted ribosome quality control (RQC) complex YloA/Tae2 family protein
MYFDALTLAAVADELHDTVLDGRIQRVLLPSPLSVALEIYARGRRWHLLLSAHPQFARAHLSASKPSRGVERATPLLLLLRK